MKKILIFCLICIAGIIFAQEEKKVNSKVISATVFKNTALVTRDGSIELSMGINNIVFSNLPTDLLNESVRISATGIGTIKILEVKVEEKFTSDTQQKSISDLEEKIDSLNLLMQVALDQISIYQSKKEFVESLKAQSAKYINEKIMQNPNISSWAEVVKYVENNLNDIYSGLRKQNLLENSYKQQINVLYQEIELSKGKRTQNYKEVNVTIETSENGKVNLQPSYLVQRATWYPLYDARIVSDSKNMELTYYGMVNQSTGEDWKDVSLTLSTAEPLSVKSLPELERWFIDTKPIPVKPNPYKNRSNTNSIFQVTYDKNRGIPAGKGSVTGYVTDKKTGEPLAGVNVLISGTNQGSSTDISGKFFIPNVPVGQYNLRITFIGYALVTLNLQIIEQNTANVVVPLEAAPFDAEEISVIAQRPYMEYSTTNSLATITSEYGSENQKQPVIYTNVYAKELSTTFEAPAKTSVPSDNSQHKVTIAVSNLPVDYIYTSIPKITNSVYLKGKINNKNEYPLLEGEINIFVDNDFINRTSLNTIVPSDTLFLALGIDDKINIKKVLTNKFQESKGLLGGSRQITYEYEIQVTNNRRSEETIVVYDQIPIPMNEDIKITLLEPQLEEKEISSDKKLEWKVKLVAGEKKIIPIKYTVEFPNNTSAYGLE